MYYFAHVKWFVDKNPLPAQPLAANEWWAVIFGSAAVVALFIAIHKLLVISGTTRRLDDRLSRYGRLIPYVVRYSTGLLFVINASKGLLFAPNVTTEAHPAAPLLSIALALAGVLLIIGWRIRFAANLILGVYAAALLLVHPIIDVLDHVEYLGIGLYLLLYGDAAYLKRLTIKTVNYLSAESLLRIFVGLDLMELAMSEKLVGITNSTNFLVHHHWNFLSSLGVTDRNFIIVAGIIEFTVGLTLVLNIAPRVTTAVVAGLMTLTAALLGVNEVFGHLFAFSLVAVVWLGRELPVATKTKKTTKAKKRPTKAAAPKPLKA